MPSENDCGFENAFPTVPESCPLEIDAIAPYTVCWTSHLATAAVLLTGGFVTATALVFGAAAVSVNGGVAAKYFSGLSGADPP